MQTTLSPTGDLATGDLAVGDAADVVAVVEIGDQHLEVLVEIGSRRGNLCDDRLIERGHSGVARFVIEMALPLLDGEARAWPRRKWRLKSSCSSGGVELEEELEHHVEHLVRARVFAVDLVDDDDGLGADFERLAEHELRLRLRAVEGIDDEEHAVDHLKDALDLAAEVGVAGSVDDVDVVILVLERGVLGLDGDAFFALEVHRVHDALDDGLVGAKGAGLPEELVDQRGFAMVIVGNDGDVANFLDDFHKKGSDRLAA